MGKLRAVPVVVAFVAFVALSAPFTQAAQASEHTDLGAASPSSSRPPSFEEAERTGQLTPEEADQFRSQLTESMNEMATEDFGPMTVARAARTGQRQYYTQDDLKFFLAVERDAQTGASVNIAQAVPLHASVNADGSVTYPDIEFGAGMGPATWGGPWGGEYIDVGTATSTNDGGVFCNDTVGENRRRGLVRRLNDTSGTYDYVGIDLTAVAEITNYSNCVDWIESAGVRMRSTNSAAIWVSQNPLADRTGNCRTTTLTVGAKWGGVDASISQPIQQCDIWDVICGNCASATSFYGTIFNGNKNSLDSQEQGAVAVMRLPQGGQSYRTYSTTIHVANA